MHTKQEFEAEEQKYQVVYSLILKEIRKHLVQKSVHTMYCVNLYGFVLHFLLFSLLFIAREIDRHLPVQQKIIAYRQLTFQIYTK